MEQVFVVSDASVDESSPAVAQPSVPLFRDASPTQIQA
jgi:hypothetical protein